MKFIEGVKRHWMILALVVVGTAIRLYHLSYSPLWLDEAWTLFAAVGGNWWETPFMDVQPALYPWFVRIAVTLLGGFPEGNIRIVSVIAGVAAIPLTWILGYRMTGIKWVGVAAATIMTVSPFAIYHSQEARPYMLLTMLFLLFLIYYFQTYTDKKWWYAVGVLSVLLVWTHYIMYVPVILTGVHAILTQKQSKEFLYGIAVFTVGAVQAPAVLTMASFRWFEGATFFYVGEQIPWGALWSFSGESVALVVALSVLAVAGLRYFYLNGTHSVSWMAIVIGGTTAFVTGISYFVMVFPRYLIMFMPVFYILVGMGIVWVYNHFSFRYPNRELVNRCLCVAFLAMVFVLWLGPINTQYNTEKDHWREHDAYMSSLVKGNDTAMILANPGYSVLFGYYCPSIADRIGRFQTGYGLIKENERTNGTVWVFVPTDPRGIQFDESQKIISYLNQNGTYKEEYRGMWQVWGVR